MWGHGRPICLEIALGYSVDTCIKCLAILVEHEMRIVDLRLLAKGQASAIPIRIQVTVRHPGRKRLSVVIRAVDEVSYGCRAVMNEE
jgi:hypothetical protein